MNFSVRGIACCTLLFLLVVTGTMAQAQVWLNPARSVGGTGSDYGAAYEANAAGERFMTGYFSDSVTIGGKVLTSLGDGDIFLAKEATWVVQIGGTGLDEGTDIAFDAAPAPQRNPQSAPIPGKARSTPSPAKASATNSPSP